MTVQLVQPRNSDEYDFDQTKLDLIKRTICKGATNDELQLFIHACKRTGLDPFMRQIFAVKRWDSSTKKEIMTIQTGIDGYRLIADRTGKYAPGKDTEFGYDNKGNIRWAKAYIKKMTPDGQWHEISAIAFWEEYVQTTREGKSTLFWLKKSHIMLSKCTEALALRKTFPAERSGIYTKEEMAQEFSPLEEHLVERIAASRNDQGRS
ncbi:phage recombination protein Bet [Simkania negevensis]|uniref:Prophage LambdaCh01, recombination protein Bet n=1 Tax=Simkania negevensis (strain ATCC VR-1471 / DSM 27360 / Z) TaxID=331113 RepID=F8L2Q7_SIMNZ|nr:phage recombination protein Bet [Simkania negevensis]CCB87753.1 prophage LambdaCh01, recombination protein Bet [Simkania negevensis Z]